MYPADPLQLWDNAADKYSSAQGKNIHKQIYQPVLEELLGNITGQHILDAGCGDGLYSLTLARRGASVFAVDGSEEMIRIASSMHVHSNLRYHIMDITKELPLNGNHFDIVLANMVLMDIPVIDIFVSETKRILKKTGSFIFSITHPCFFCSDWITDTRQQKLFKRVDNYLDEKIDTLDFWGRTMHYHRPLSFYFNAIEKAGMCVRSFREPIPQKEFLISHPDQWYNSRILSFVVMKAIKALM